MDSKILKNVPNKLHLKKGGTCLKKCAYLTQNTLQMVEGIVFIFKYRYLLKKNLKHILLGAMHYL